MKGLNPNKKKLILGLTGSFGSGKTAVAKIFKNYGAKIIDADRIAHYLLKPQNKIYQRILGSFGQTIIARDKTIDREKLACLVFNNKNLLEKLNQIMHPEIIRIMRREIKKSPKKVIVLDAPLLIEAGLKKWVDKLIVVKIKRKKQIERILKKSKLTRQEILKRIKSQLPLQDKVRRADFVIDNNGTLKSTKRQVREVWSKLSATKIGGFNSHS